MQEFIERVRIALRNRARQRLASEYARNITRNKRIIAQLGLLNARAEIEAVSARIADDWPASDALKPQAHIVAGRTCWQIPENHFQSDLKHFRQDFCMPRGVVEDDVGVQP